MGNKRTRKGKNNVRGGLNANVYDIIISSMNKLNNDVKNLGTIIMNIKNSQNQIQEQKIDDTKVEKPINEESNNNIPQDILVKIEEQKQEMNDVLEEINEKEEKIQEEQQPTSNETNDGDEKLAESKEELQNDIKLLTDQINKGVEDNSLLKNKPQRNRSFYSNTRTWSQWFYGFVEYYDELKKSLTNIIENRYYNSILRKPANERTQTEKDMIEKVENLEIEMTNMNKTIASKGGFRRKKYTRKNKK